MGKVLDINADRAADSIKYTASSVVRQVILLQELAAQINDASAEVRSLTKKYEAAELELRASRSALLTDFTGDLGLLVDHE